MTPSDAARALQALRKVRKGGRPRTDAERCKCGRFTLRCAKARAHHCPTEDAPTIQPPAPKP